MGNKKHKKYRYRKRIFLNEDYESSVYVVAIVEKLKARGASAKSGDSKGSAKLILESSYEGISLNFELDLPDQVEESLSKIKAFETLLKQFRKAVENEAKARKQRSYEHIKDSVVTVH